MFTVTSGTLENLRAAVEAHRSSVTKAEYRAMRGAVDHLAEREDDGEIPAYCPAPFDHERPEHFCNTSGDVA
ncbi:hypothetical protein ACIOG4_37615 [Streptomyces microflavus]|uniref:hypothetical protein n=1 Tax=Streptomyces microflavus TaxID=1919 RepID=UPI00381D771B